MTKPYDFDAWYDENDGGSKTRPVRFLGRLWQIPVDPPAAPLLRMQRAYRMLADRGVALTDELPADIAEMMSEQRLLVELVGEKLVDEWVAAGATMTRLSAITWRLYRHYAGLSPLDGDEAATDAEGEPQAPEGASETSSAGSSTTGP